MSHLLAVRMAIGLEVTVALTIQITPWQALRPKRVWSCPQVSLAVTSLLGLCERRGTQWCHYTIE